VISHGGASYLSACLPQAGRPGRHEPGKSHQLGTRPAVALASYGGQARLPGIGYSVSGIRKQLR